MFPHLSSNIPDSGHLKQRIPGYIHWLCHTRTDDHVHLWSPQKLPYIFPFHVVSHPPSTPVYPSSCCRQRVHLHQQQQLFVSILHGTHVVHSVQLCVNDTFSCYWFRLGITHVQAVNLANRLGPILIQ